MFIIQPKYIQFRMRVQRRLLSQTDGLCRLVLSRMWSVIAIARTANLCAIEYSANVTALSIVSGKTLKLNIADQQGQLSKPDPVRNLQRCVYPLITPRLEP
jgi:hypothetical protein